MIALRMVVTISAGTRPHLRAGTDGLCRPPILVSPSPLDTESTGSHPHYPGSVRNCTTTISAGHHEAEANGTGTTDVVTTEVVVVAGTGALAKRGGGAATTAAAAGTVSGDTAGNEEAVAETETGSMAVAIISDLWK